MGNQKLILGTAALLAVLSTPAFAGQLVTNGDFGTNFGIGQFNQTLPGTMGGQNSTHQGTTASGWSVIANPAVDSGMAGTYGFIFSNSTAFTTTDAT